MTNEVGTKRKAKIGKGPAACGTAGAVLADDDVGREAHGSGVPVVKGIDVVHVVLVGADGAGEMVVFADTNGIVRRGALGRRDLPPNTGHVVRFVGFAAANLAGALDGVEIVVKDAVPGEARPLTTIYDRHCWSWIAQPGANLVALVVVRAVELDFVDGAVLLIVKKGEMIVTAGTFHALKRKDDPLAGRKLRSGPGLPALGGANGFAGRLQFEKSWTWTRARAERGCNKDTEKEKSSGVWHGDAS
jgi:hypothetical protein